jgi:DNA-binding protein HU-beta
LIEGSGITILNRERRGEGMNKGDLVHELAKVTGTNKVAQAAVNCVFHTITKAFKKKGEIALVGFGSFKIGKRNARTGRNPKTGEAIMVEAKNTQKFAAGKALKDAVS